MGPPPKTTTTTTITTTTTSKQGRSVSSRKWSHLGEGFFPHSMGGTFFLANIPTSALPIPRSPALYRQDTSYAWSPDCGRDKLTKLHPTSLGASVVNPLGSLP